MRTQLKRMINNILGLLLKGFSWDKIKLLLQDPVFNNLPNEHICINEGGECEALIHMLSICVDLRQTPKWETSDKRFWYAVALALEQSAKLFEEAQANQHWKRAHTALMYYFGDMTKGLLPYFFNQSCASAKKAKTSAIDFDMLTQKMPNVFGKCETDFKQKYKNYRDELKAERVAKIQAAKMKKKKEEEEARKEAQENAKKLADQDDIIAQLRAKLELAAKTSGSKTEENKGEGSGEGSSDSDSDDDYENDSMLVNGSSSAPHTPIQSKNSPPQTPNSLKHLSMADTRTPISPSVFD